MRHTEQSKNENIAVTQRTLKRYEKLAWEIFAKALQTSRQGV